MTTDTSPLPSTDGLTVRDSATPATGFIGRIPVRNIWLLMLYASELYHELPPARSVDVEDDPDELPNLVAELLTDAVERRMRRNLSFGYRRRRADLSRVRGRIDLLKTERRLLLQRGRVACSFDELTVDTPRNRFVKAALDLLTGIVRDTDLAHHCRELSLRMERAGVTGDPASYRSRQPREPLSRLGRLAAEDRRMLAAARLAFDLTLPTEDPGAYLIATPDRAGMRGWELFERAVAGFYKVVLSRKGWHISSQRTLRWFVDAEDSSPDIRKVLPDLRPDLLLERPIENLAAGPRRIIIDTKFSEILQSGRYGNPTFDSANIYQVYAYIRSQEREGDPPSIDSTGVLLHPSMGVDFNEYALIQKHKIRFATVDLAADSREIRRQLLRIPCGDVVG